ncbi:glycosyltransferase involved in cell wall biosynthesis [Xanthomonas arboricola]|uniref:glycosyltransferase n=1 Tax=Xanthomonas sp. 3793 TaxID=3035312 RepID=UPI0021679FFB|nr:glycosyltransferase [Xanthomonas sp. 3793]MCS3747463.1 glycosyltransferase involved in cell wall biosynthesis [Xanthomonas sp. 3793]
MRIVIDMQGVQSESRFRGIGRYSAALAQAMVRNGKGHEFWLAVNGHMPGIDELREVFDGLLPQSRIVSFTTPAPTHWQEGCNTWRREAAERVREAFLRDLLPDMVHVSSMIEGAQDQVVTSIGHQSGVRTAATLYDLIPLHNPEYLAAEWVKDWYSSKIASLKRADLLLAISEHARAEAIESLGLDVQRVVNISSAASEIFRPHVLSNEERAALLSRHGIQDRYVMYSGAMDSRKNAGRLVEAFAGFPAEKLRACQLVIAGKLPPLEQERLQLLARRYGLSEDRIVFAGYVSDKELVLLYAAAELYVFPSLYEGFGLPALEAMACGTATIGSSLTSVPEVIGRSDALFDPCDVQAIRSSMLRVLSDEAFAQSLREHAAVQAGKFSWDASARRALEAFESRHEALVHTPLWPVAVQTVERGEAELVKEIAALGSDAATPAQQDLVDVAAAIAENQVTALQAHRYHGDLPLRLRWRVEGPFDSSYSLALVNRELALALRERGNDVALHSTEGPGDFAADAQFLASRQDVAQLHAREPALPPAEADVSSRLLYPPRVADMRSRFNLLHDYAWEESEFPWEWADAFNDALQGISALSHHVEKILIDSGVSIPISVGEAGVDHWTRVHSDKSYPCEGKKFRFLHVSSCFPRKGADVLLKAFGDAFNSSDDVTLVIKTFANPHNEIRRWVEEARGAREDFPDVRIIEEDLSEPRLKRLYETSHVLVAPSRAEGFGLPMAEAMMSGLGVITTGWGGQLDFCNEQTAWLVDYSFERAQSHFGMFNSVWAEPDRDHLAEIMRELHRLPDEQRMFKVKKAQALLLERFQWENVAARTENLVRQIAASPPRRSAPVTAWVSSWKTKCGIASYSEHLIGNLGYGVHILSPHATDQLEPDAMNVHRCWDSSAPDDLLGLEASLHAVNAEVVVIQFQYGFFEFKALSRLLQAQKRAGRAIVVMMHATQDPVHVPERKLAMLVDALRLCDRILVHSVSDLNRLKVLGLVDNVAIFPHGIVDLPVVPAGTKKTTGRRFRLGSYGFCLPHKGLPQLIEAVALLVARGHDVSLRMVNAIYPVGESEKLAVELRDLVSRLDLAERVEFHMDYLPEALSFELLHDTDLIVFPYQGTAESSSAAVRYGLATTRPVAVTPIAIFDDVGDAVVRLPGTDPAHLASGLAAIVENSRLLDESNQVALKWREAHRYSRLGRRLSNIIRALCSQRVDASFLSRSS